jgi:hypothetical protein
VAWTAADNCGNVATCSASFAIEDTSAPDITCPPDASVSVPDPYDPTVTGSASATDVCDGPVAASYADMDPQIQQFCPTVSWFTRVWSATDECQSASSCEQLIDLTEPIPEGFCCAPDGGALTLIDDNNVCTTDVCDAATGEVTHVDDSQCDDTLWCNGMEFCDPVSGCQPGPEPCADPCHIYCDEETDTCAWCILDITGIFNPANGGYIDGLDYGYFSGCFGECFSPGDECSVANFDADPDNCVGSGDFAPFAGCFSYPCAACDNCAGPGRGEPREETDGAGLRVVAVTTPTGTDYADRPPATDKVIGVGEKVYFELWAHRTDVEAANANGFAAVYANLLYDTDMLDAGRLVPGDLFANLARGTVDENRGLISAMGGCARLGDRQLGVSPAWVRVVTIEMRVRAPGASAVRLAPAAEPFGVAVLDRFGNLDDYRITYTGAKLRIQELPHVEDYERSSDKRVTGDRGR